MPFNPFVVTAPHVVYACLGGFVVLFGMLSLLIREKLYIGEALLAFVFGVIIGPYAANIFNPRGWGDGSDHVSDTIALEVTRVILAVGVFAIGVELPKAYMARHWKSLFYLLGPVMTWGWFVSAGLIYALIPGLSFLSSLAIAACLTPTDPILASAVVGGKYAVKHVPVHLRHLLAAESGCNDGAAFPFLYIAIYLVIEKSDRHAIQDWFLITWFYEVGLGIVLGSLIGFAFRHLMKFCERKDLIDRQSYVAQYLSLAIFTIGVLTLLGSDDLLAAFACGTAFAWDGFFNRQTEQSVFSSVIDLLFNVAAFVFIGAWMPFNAFNNAELTLSVWRLVVIAILVLLLRRLPIILALYRWIPDIKTFREAVFSGHFGPIGVGAIFISALAKEKLPHPESPTEDQAELLAATIQPVVAFMVLTSIMIHGLSIPFFSLGRRVHSVSRTWSRAQAVGPEWATHTRRVSRPEDVVINRDDQMENGEVFPEKNLTPEAKTPGSTTPIKKQPSAMGGDEKALVEGRPDAPPDGDVEERQWKEGKNIVIERRHAPGEEVEVEVIRSDTPTAERQVLATLRGPAAAIDETLNNPTEHFKAAIAQREKEAEKGLQHAKEGIKEGILEIEHELTGSSSSPRDEVPADGPSAAAQRRDNDDDDAEWASEDGSESTLDDAANQHARSKSSSKLKHLAKSHPSTSSRRRRNSMRRGVLGLTHTVRSSAHGDGGGEDEHGRGRTSAAHTRPELANAAHRRVESLRTPVHRSSSPAQSIRSVRFADASGRQPSQRSDERESPTDSVRVTFDLPSDART